MRDFQVQSAWGAIAALALLQCLGAITFNALLYHLGPNMLPCEENVRGRFIIRVSGKIFLSIWGLGWMFGFFFFEVLTINLVARYFHGNGIGTLLRLTNPLSVVKLLLALIFARILFFLHHDYPFPKPRGQRLLPMFLVGSFILSTFIADHHQLSGGRIADGGACILGLLLGSLFFVVGYASPELFYLFGLMGGGVAVMMACSMLLQSDRLSIDGMFLCVAAALLMLWQVKRLKSNAASREEEGKKKERRKRGSVHLGRMTSAR
jgi:hypothetical protein